MKRAARRPPRTAPRTIIAMKYFFSRSSLQVAGDVEEVGEVGEAVGEGCTPVTSTTNGMVALRPSGRCSSAYNVKMISGLIGFALTVQFTFIHSFVILSSPSQLREHRPLSPGPKGQLESLLWKSCFAGPDISRPVPSFLRLKFQRESRAE